MAATGRAFFVSRVADLSIKPLRPLSPPFSHHLLVRPSLPAIAGRRRSSPVLSCLVSGVDGGGVSDDFVSTRKSGFGREFSVIANMLKRIEPLDTSVIAKGVSDSAKDSMKQTISTMLGLLPSDQFSVMVRVSKRPLDRLLTSSIITGYTLWNADYRVSLMRNLDLSPESLKRSSLLGENEVSKVKREENEDEGGEAGTDGCIDDVDSMNLQSFGDLSTEALNYIQQLELELAAAKKDLDAQKQENLKLECFRESNNDLLDYLRSLESEMVTELSRPSSLEVEEIIHQLVQNVLQRFYKDETTSDFMADSAMGSTEGCHNSDIEVSDTVVTSRDYLAKLLFWCMLMGHHLRGLENRLHLSCVVGLL